MKEDCSLTTTAQFPKPKHFYNSSEFKTAGLIEKKNKTDYNGLLNSWL